MYNTEIYKLAHKILMKAIEEKTSVIVNQKNDNGVSSYFYQDKLGIPAYLELYMSNYADVDGKMGLSVICQKSFTSNGSIFINFNKVKTLEISKHYERYLLKIDDITFNFTSDLKL